MIIFHEGLPGSGKSYETMLSHIIPALKNGRVVLARIDGLNYQQIADLAGISEERCHELLKHLTEEQTKEIWKHFKRDMLVVLDELQNYWPSSRQKLGEEITKFVAEHRHYGLDIVAAGQVLNDCHSLWKGRVDTLIRFRKLDAVGKANSYKWIALKRTDNGKFQEVSSGKREYDPMYFGAYASHDAGTGNLANYADSRTDVRNSRPMRLIKIYGVVALVAVGFLVWYFYAGTHKADDKAKDRPMASQSQAQTVMPQPVAVAQVRPVRVTVSEVVGQVDSEASDYIEEMRQKGRMRLAGVLFSGSRISAVLEFRDDSLRVVERLTTEQLRGLGWYVMISADGMTATISKPGKTYIATQWPVQDDREKSPSQMPEQTRRNISEQASQAPQPFVGS